MLHMTLTYVDDHKSARPRTTTAQLEITRAGGDDAYADYDVRLVDYAAKPHCRVQTVKIVRYPRSRGALALLQLALTELGLTGRTGPYRELSLGDARELSKGEVP